MIGSSQLRIVRRADVTAVRQLRHALHAFLALFINEGEFLEDVLLAVGEVLSNSVEHARSRGAGNLEIVARSGMDGTLAVEVADGGSFVERDPLPNRGFGLRIAKAIARTVTIETGEGTRVELVFDAARL